MKKIISFVILFLPFLMHSEPLTLYRLINESGFNGQWNIERDIPLKLKEKLFSQGFKDVGCVDTLLPRKNLVNGFSMSGIIKEFKFISAGLVSEGMGGFQKYTVKIRINYEIYSPASPKIPQSFEIKREISDNKLGLTFMGGPSGYRNMHDVSLFDQLQTVDFNSPEFNQTIYGKCLNAVMDDTVNKIRFLLGSSVLSQYSNSMNLSDAEWTFTAGDSEAFAQKDFVENFWKNVRPGRKDKPTPDFSGFGWYRLKVFIPGKFRDKSLVLKLGRIGDADTAYINNTRIGSQGSFPPEFKPARETNRSYAIPSVFIKFDEINVLAVRVYCRQKPGGLLDDKITIESSK
jgi:hypothetical protein